MDLRSRLLLFMPVQSSAPVILHLSIRRRVAGLRMCACPIDSPLCLLLHALGMSEIRTRVCPQ